MSFFSSFFSCLLCHTNHTCQSTCRFLDGRLKPRSTDTEIHALCVILTYFPFDFSRATSPSADHSDARAARASAPLQIFHRGFKRRSLPIKVEKSAKMRALQTLTLLLLLHQVRRVNERDGMKMCRLFFSLSLFQIAGVLRKL